MKKIKAVIFDWGGVLIDNPMPGMMKHFAEALCVSVEAYAGAHAKFITEFEKGSVSEETFWENVCGELKVERPAEESLWGRVFESLFSVKAEMTELAEKLRDAGFKIALLSNTEPPSVPYFKRLKPDIFDAVVLSCVERTRKPERRIYELTLERLGCLAEEAVLIDDRQDYLKGAEEVRLKTIAFKSCEQAKEELTRLAVVWSEIKI